MSTAAFFQAVQEGPAQRALAEVGAAVAESEAVLLHEAGSAVATVEDCSKQTLLGGGKRLRPALAVICARAAGGADDARSLAHVGAALEMIHMATLVHDDVIDEASLRRGRATASALHGNTAAVLSGDVLLAKAMRLLALHSDIRIIQMVSSAVVEMAEGEVREIECRGVMALSEEEHLRVLRMKTAAFIECCCRVGARLAGACEQTEDALGRYGHNLGLAFQLADDLLDFRGDRAKTGKPRATDFREGQATLPLIYLMPALSEEETAFVSSRFGNGAADEDLGRIAGWMEERGAFSAAASRASGFASSAVGALAPLPPSEERVLLEAVARFVVEREG